MKRLSLLWFPVGFAIAILIAYALVRLIGVVPSMTPTEKREARLKYMREVVTVNLYEIGFVGTVVEISPIPDTTLQRVVVERQDSQGTSLFNALADEKTEFAVGQKVRRDVVIIAVHEFGGLIEVPWATPIIEPPDANKVKPNW